MYGNAGYINKMIKAGKNNFSLIREKGVDIIYASGTLTTRSFHHVNGDRIKPIVTSEILKMVCFIITAVPLT